MSIVQTLTEGIVQRDMAKEGQALLNKCFARETPSSDV